MLTLNPLSTLNIIIKLLIFESQLNNSNIVYLDIRIYIYWKGRSCKHCLSSDKNTNISVPIGKQSKNKFLFAPLKLKFILLEFAFHFEGIVTSAFI